MASFEDRSVRSTLREIPSLAQANFSQRQSGRYERTTIALDELVTAKGRNRLASLPITTAPAATILVGSSDPDALASDLHGILQQHQAARDLGDLRRTLTAPLDPLAKNALVTSHSRFVLPLSSGESALLHIGPVSSRILHEENLQLGPTTIALVFPGGAARLQRGQESTPLPLQDLLTIQQHLTSRGHDTISFPLGSFRWKDTGGLMVRGA